MRSNGKSVTLDPAANLYLVDTKPEVRVYILSKETEDRRVAVVENSMSKRRKASRTNKRMKGRPF